MPTRVNKRSFKFCKSKLSRNLPICGPKHGEKQKLFEPQDTKIWANEKVKKVMRFVILNQK